MIVRYHFDKALLLFLGWLLFPAISVFGQFTLEGEVRPRTELRHGYKTLPSSDDEAALFTEQRSRINLGYNKEDYDIGLTVQDVRIWGNQNQLNKSDGLFSIHEAWGQIHFSPIVSLKAGRQELVYDDQRILGSVGWTAQGRSHDALLLKISKKNWALHTGWAYNQDNNPPEPAKLFGSYYAGVQNYKTLQYTWFNHQSKAANISLLALNNGVQLPDSSTNFTQTVGVTGNYSLENINLSGSLYYQTGRDPANMEVEAWLASLNATYSGFEKLKLTVGGDYLSGSKVDDEKNRSFNPLYGTHHKFYGFMDYFYVGNGHSQSVGTNTNAAGLVDLYLKASMQFTDASSLLLHAHEFFAPVEIRNPIDLSSELNSRLGTEIDVVFSHAITDEVSFKAGYAQMFGTSSLSALKGGNQDEWASWAWLMISFNPVFFTTK
ncbi:alginate export family protein [Fodinibius salsisoli]|uniref:Alginate export family protein n=1 Tax=Fodinibius salsisoli TaxID=2820877 RepID=A0ABT3PTH5_9BACT|nr:alginate export family protein [Fodinibius salsisoli]MCW9709155.1 alginate export family protein [Fodinibius salsisoli]